MQIGCRVTKLNHTSEMKCEKTSILSKSMVCCLNLNHPVARPYYQFPRPKYRLYGRIFYISYSFLGHMTQTPDTICLTEFNAELLIRIKSRDLRSATELLTTSEKTSDSSIICEGAGERSGSAAKGGAATELLTTSEGT